MPIPTALAKEASRNEVPPRAVRTIKLFHRYLHNRWTTLRSTVPLTAKIASRQSA